MSTCGNQYLAINGKEKCGGINMEDPDFSMTDFANVELGDAGEPVLLHLKNDSPSDGYFIFMFTTE